MSVRVADRSLSKMEYVRNAQQMVYLIQERIAKYINKIDKDKRYKHLSKSSQYSVWNSPIYHAQMIYKYCQIANMMRTPDNRLKCLSIASLNLQLLETSIQTFYKSFKAVIKDKFIELLTDKIDYQKRLIDGVEKYCRNNNC